MLTPYIVLFAIIGTVLANGPVRAKAVAEVLNGNSGAFASAEADSSSCETSSPRDIKKCYRNETYAICKVGCPTNYCPTDDRRAIVACDPPQPCLSGCICKQNYLRRSYKDKRCILARECSPVKCTRPNEIWNPCPSACLVENCNNMVRPQKKCVNPYSSCRPRCVCKDGYFRNQSGICIPGSQCPKPCSVPSECIRTCANPNPPNCPYNKPPNSNEDGCQCQSGQILLETGGKCIKIENCPKGCNSDPHAVATECPVPCPATCEMPEPMLTCKRKCDPIGCQCERGYILSNGKCVLPDYCEGSNPCGVNATFTSCKSYCPNDYCPVDDTRAIVVCEYYPFSPCYPGCICKSNYRRKSYEDNRCIFASECSPVNCTRPNEKWNSCPPDTLLQTCEDVDKDLPKSSKPVANCNPQCVCKRNYYRNASDICISSEDCRKSLKNSSEPVCGYNEEYVKCKTICPPQSCENSYTEYECPDAPKCEPGCDCIKDHLRNASSVCIPNNECSPPQPECGFNEKPTSCRKICPPQNCGIDPAAVLCLIKDNCEPGCDCIESHLRNASGICIPSNQCPPECGDNEKPTSCRTICPPQECGVNPALIRCKKPDCEQGCDCTDGYLRNASGICIPSDQCEPKCGLNEIPVRCKIVCPPQSCLSRYALFKCLGEIPCEPGCDCKRGYLRDNTGVCIPSEQCDQSNCSIPRKCRPTCAVPNPKNCSYSEPPNTNEDACQCQKGYVLSDPDGNCIKVEDCPQESSCNGDPNAVIKECPWPCPSTCASPNTIQCRKACYPIGCQCKPGYLLSSNNGNCILPDKCQGGNPCGVNGTFSDCSFRCPNQNCPQDDDLTVVACKPGRPCPPGCLCKENYKRKSYEENICVLASDCSPVNCTRPNEVWNPCSQYLAERCEDLDNKQLCKDQPGTNCKPRCVCAPEYYRDKNNTCVYKKDCPNQCPISRKCRRTCANRNPSNCTTTKPPTKNDDGCQCKEGYILSKLDDKCIQDENCPCESDD